MGLSDEVLRVRGNDLGFWRELALKTAWHSGREKDDQMVEHFWRIGCLAKEITERRPVPLWLKNEMRYADVREMGMGGSSFSPLRRILLGELQYRGRRHRGGFWWDGDKRKGGTLLPSERLKSAREENDEYEFGVHHVMPFGRYTKVC